MTKLLVGLACGLALTVSGSAFATDMTDQTEKLLEEMGLSPDVLEGMDEELAVPQEWIDKSKEEEGPLRIRWNVDELEFQWQRDLFQARYPWIEIEFLHAPGPAASTQPRLAYTQGTIVMDVANTIGREHALWVEIDGFEDLTDLPAAQSQVPGGVAEDGLTAAFSTNSYCISYNEDAVDPADLPETWEDLVNNDRFGDGKIGLSVNMTVWLPYLTYENGMDWAIDYMDKLYALKPQRRREGFVMISKLVGLGEMQIGIPQADKQVYRSRIDDIPVAWHCPSPVPLGFTEMAIIKGNPRPYQSKLFLNWALARESQLAAFHTGRARPGNKYLFPDFTEYPEVTRGKPFIPKNAEIIEITKQLLEPWGERYEAQ